MNENRADGVKGSSREIKKPKTTRVSNCINICIASNIIKSVTHYKFENK